MPVALYPGTFDPVTRGHMDIAIRATKIFSKVIAVVGVNPAKKTLFTVDERVTLARECLKDVPRIQVIHYEGLIVDCLKQTGATTIIRGLRALSDFDYEFQMAFTNRNLHVKAETVFLTPSVEYVFLNSTLVKQIASLGGDVSSYVPECVRKALVRKLAGQKPPRKGAVA